jgi:hypothetical protein
MALFGGARDISLFRGLNRELMGDIISQQCAVYKPQLAETKVNIYGETPGVRYFTEPVLLNCLISRDNQNYPESDLGIDFNWGIEFRFLRDDLVDANLVVEVGDIILYQESYYEIDSTISNQYIVGKNPDYPNAPNPLETGLDQFGSNWSVLAKTHIIPADKLGISPRKERF